MLMCLNGNSSPGILAVKSQAGIPSYVELLYSSFLEDGSASGVMCTARISSDPSLISVPMFERSKD